MKRFTKGRFLRALVPHTRITRALVAVACAGVLTTSCDVHGVSNPGSLTTFTISPLTQTLGINGTQQFTAVGADFAGVNVPVNPVWTVVTGGGAINASGMFTAGTTTGTFTKTVTATSGGMSATATIIVTPGPLATIVVTPNPMTLAIGATQQYVAVGKDASGNIVNFTPTWSVVAAGGAISSTGLFTAGAVAGTFTNTIQASSLSIKGNATVTVTPGPLATIAVTPNPITLTIGGVQLFTAVGKDSSGNILTIAPVWSVAAGGGSIGALGVFTAGNTPGTFPNTVTATVGTISGTATVTVIAGAAATITVTPNPVSLAIGQTQGFTAVAKDAGGNVVGITPVWSVVVGGGTIDPATGIFTAGAVPGTFTNTVKATSGTLSGFATVTVNPPIVIPVGPQLTTITVSPNPVILLANAIQQFSATGRDGNGNPFAISPTWSVVNPLAGTINPNTGVFSASANAGTYPNTIKATSGSISGFATVTITTTPPALATITVTPNPAFMLTGATQQFTAVGRDAQGNIFLPITPVWSVSDPLAGSINAATGLFTALNAAGTYLNVVHATVGVTTGAATVVENSAAAPPPFLALGGAALNGVMAGTAFSCSSLGTINANISISPGSTVTGFPPCVITGVQHLNDAVAVQDQVDLAAAYTTLAGLPCGTIISADLGGTTKLPGVYCNGTAMGLTGDLILDGNGNPNAVFVFQMGTSLTTAGRVLLQNGAQAKNVYWQVGSSATLGTATAFQGNILALTSISLLDGTTMIGRALARNGAVSMTTLNTITLP